MKIDIKQTQRIQARAVGNAVFLETPKGSGNVASFSCDSNASALFATKAINACLEHENRRGWDEGWKDAWLEAEKTEE